MRLGDASVSRLARSPHTDETKQKISDSLSGRKLTRRHREAIADSAAGWSEKSRKKSAVSRMIKAAKRRKELADFKRASYQQMVLSQREEVKQLHLITSPRMQMEFDRKYRTAGQMSPQDMARVWITTAMQHGFHHGKSKFAITKRGMKAVVRLRSWLADVGIYPERYFRSIFKAASFARMHGRKFQPYVNSAMSLTYFKTYVEWEKRLIANDEGWAEMLHETGMHTLPRTAQDQLLESGEFIMTMLSAINATTEVLVERYFASISPHLLFFMPQAQAGIKAGRGTREQQQIFRALARDEKLQAKYRPFYDAAMKFVGKGEQAREKAMRAHDNILGRMKAAYDEGVKDVRLDLVDQM